MFIPGSKNPFNRDSISVRLNHILAAHFKADTDDAEIQRPPRFDRQKKPDEPVNAFIPKPDLDPRIQKVQF